MITAMVILAKAISTHQPDSEKKLSYSQAIDIYDIFLHVRGISSTQKITIPTTPHTILHTLCSLNVCRQIIHVRIWLAMQNIKNVIYAPAPNSRPNRFIPISENSTSIESAML
jgi:hypothetical protein